MKQIKEIDFCYDRIRYAMTFFLNEFVRERIFQKLKQEFFQEEEDKRERERCE